MNGSPASGSILPSSAPHSLRRTKAVLIYRRTGNLRAVQLLLGHARIESTVRYLGIEVDDAIEIAEWYFTRRQPLTHELFKGLDVRPVEDDLAPP
jgi:site-specific recombinase XerD